MHFSLLLARTMHARVHACMHATIVTRLHDWMVPAQTSPCRSLSAFCQRRIRRWAGSCRAAESFSSIPVAPRRALLQLA